MNPFSASCRLLLAAALAAPSILGAEVKPGGLAAAEELFKAGKFAEAEDLFGRILKEEPDRFQALLGMGSVALLGNRLDEAERWLKQAAALKTEDKSAAERLAEVYYRRDDFERAAPLYRTLGKEAVARKLESFKGAKPYQIEGAESACVKFLQTDPLPLVQVKVNGSDANFIIDTGASEIYLDTDYARKVGAALFGTTTGTFGGGKQAPAEHGRIDSLALGGLVVRNVPALVLSTRRFAAVAGGRSVDGILGTVVLSHFISTLDYPAGELVLRRKTAEQLRALEQQATAEAAVSVPFWMAGDHFMVAWGRVGKSQPLLLFVDTGLAGGGFVGPQSTLGEAGIELPQGPERQGVGGGGTVKIVPFVVEDLSLGPVTEHNISGFFGPFPPSLEFSEGFRIGGIISHQFFRSYALTFDFTGMRLLLRRKPA
jgi:hypothetical protein